MVAVRIEIHMSKEMFFLQLKSTPAVERIQPSNVFLQAKILGCGARAQVGAISGSCTGAAQARRRDYTVRPGPANSPAACSREDRRTDMERGRWTGGRTDGRTDAKTSEERHNFYEERPVGFGQRGATV